MNKRILRKRILSLSMLFTVLLNTIMSSGITNGLAYAISDKTSVFKGENSSFNLKVNQGQDIPAGGTIDGRAPFNINLTGMKVPLKGDYISDPDDSRYISKGDIVVLTRAEYFPNVEITAVGNKDVIIGTDKIATATLAADKITLTFNGADIFFNGGKKGATINLSFGAIGLNKTPGLSIDSPIFGDNFKFANAQLDQAYTMSMKSNSSAENSMINTSHFRDGFIEWESTVISHDKTDTSIRMPLGKKVYHNDLTAVGKYVEGSFTIDGQPAIPTITGNVLTYTIPDGGETKTDAVIKFRTWIPKNKYYYEYNSGGNQTINNSTAKLQNEDGTVDIKSANGWRVNFIPNWIEVNNKRVLKVEDNGDKFITWTVDVNGQRSSNLIKSGLKNFQITAPLPAGLTFDSAEYQLLENGVWTTPKSISEGPGGVYKDVWSDNGTLNTQVRLFIKTKVVSGSTFTLNAKTNWDLDVPADGIQNNDSTVNVSDLDSITIGNHAMTKTASVSMDDFNIGAVTWNVGLNLQYNEPNAVVYDMLVHGGSLDVLDNIDTNQYVSQEVVSKIKTELSKKGSPNTWMWQKYKEGSLIKNNLTVEVIPIFKDGKQVADLIKSTGYKGEINSVFTFRSVVNNPDIMFRQDINVDKARSNYAFLFYGDNYGKDVGGSTNSHIHMLDKQMLYASKPMDIVNNVEIKAPQWNRPAQNLWNYVVPNDPNWFTSNNFTDDYIVAGYDQKTKTATFRLAVNFPGYKTDVMAKDGGNRVIKDIKLTDTLPEGWEFVEFAPGVDFELRKGYSDNGSGTAYGTLMRADGIISKDSPEHVVKLDKSGNVGTFTFDKLESPYVILVKARPTNEALNKYNLGQNTVENTAEFSMKFGDTLKSVTEKHKVIVPVQTLNKSVKKPVSGVQEWTVNYTPSFNLNNGVYLEDTLSPGLKLRKDIDGNVSLLPSDIAVYKGELTPNGTLKRIGEPLDLTKADSEVKVEVDWGTETTPTKLRFRMSNPNELYQFVYQTESKGMIAGTWATNKIALVGDDTLPAIGAESKVQLDESDVSANATDNGILYVRKVGPDGKPLQGVEISFLNADGSPYEDINGIVQGPWVTDKNGNIPPIIIQNPGLYMVKQTYIDELTYLPTTKIYWVRAIDTKGVPVLVDGKNITANDPLIIPTPDQGKVTITNKVTGIGGDKIKNFTYKVKFEGEGQEGSFAWTKSDGTKSDATNRIKSGDTFTLKDGESFILPALPGGIKYTITQDDYTIDEYTTIPQERIFTDTIVNNFNHKADYVNNRSLFGSLFISNKVTGNGGSIEKEFEYTVNFAGEGVATNYKYIKNGKEFTINNGGTIKLKDSESVIFNDILKDTTYKVTQADYTSDEYTTKPETREYTGVIPEKAIVKAEYINNRTIYSNLLISNQVTGRDGDTLKDFEYKVEFTGEGLDKGFNYVKTDGTTNTPGTIKSGDMVTLKHGESIIISDIPVGMDYTVTQRDYTFEDYTTNPNSRVFEGTIKENILEKAPYINNRFIKGDLLIGNTVTGKDGDKNKAFEYTINFEGFEADKTYSYTKEDGSTGEIKSGDKISLKDSEIITIKDLPVGLKYDVTQKDYNNVGYTTDPTERIYTGNIEKDKLSEARYVNERVLRGGLLIGNTVTGKDGEKDKNFEYTVNFEGYEADKTYSYTREDGTFGIITSGGTVLLRDGQTITIEGLPTDIVYTVTQSEYTNDGYTTNPENRVYTGKIIKAKVSEARYINDRVLKGDLLVGNIVTGKDGDKNKAFEYTITFEGYGADKIYSYTKKDGTKAIIKSGDKVKLKDSETITIKDLPTELKYKVLQKDYTDVGYTTNPKERVYEGTIENNKTLEARYINDRVLRNDLTIGNKVTGRDGDKSKNFEYTVNFKGYEADKTYSYKKSDGSTGTIKSGDKVNLKDGETITIIDLPTDTEYTVNQTDYLNEGYTTNPEDRIYTGKIVESNPSEVTYTNDKVLRGGLLIGNKVTGKDGDQNKDFEYTITFEGYEADKTYSYTKNDGSTGTIKSGDKINLKDSESIVIKDLPSDIKYLVTQKDYNDVGYTTSPKERVYTGNIEEDKLLEARFVNDRVLRSTLLISNTVTGKDGDKNKNFQYTIDFKGYEADKTYSYTRNNGTSGTIKSGETILLKDGESIIIEGLPTDVLYTVTQGDALNEGYTTNPIDRVYTGKIVENKSSEAKYINNKVLRGGLSIANKVTGKDGDKNKEFEYTIKFEGYEADKTYSYTRADGSTGEIKSGGKITLKDGECIVIQNLPSGIKYEVMQKDYSGEDYVTTPKELILKGDIQENKVISLNYENNKSLPMLHGVLRNNNTGEIIPNAKIIVTNLTTGEVKVITTNSNGEYSMNVKADEEYTITYDKIVKIDDKEVKITFTQKATVDNGVKGGEDVPADITAVGVFLMKNPEGKLSLMNSEFTKKAKIYLKDSQGKYILDKSGKPKAFELSDKGTFSIEGLSEQTYSMELRYAFENGTDVVVSRSKLNIKADGEFNISEQLVDPYGKITDRKTGETIENAEVTLYYADTPRNRAKGIVPGTKVVLPKIDGFEPNDNLSPIQFSDKNGLYAYMVFPETDYYIEVVKEGYIKYKSETISVEKDLVKYDIQMDKEEVVVEPENPTDKDSKGETQENKELTSGNKPPSTGDNGLSPYVIGGFISSLTILFLLFILRVKNRKSNNGSTK